MATPRKGIIYTLTDPRDDTIRYVGKTTKAPLERLAQHLGSPTNPAMRVWLTTLGSQGLLPKMDTVATVPVERLAAEEAKQIAKHARTHRLLNSPYYQSNLADLWSTSDIGKPPAGPRRPSPFDAPAAALQHRLYGRIAEARACGELPSYAVFFRTLLLAPVLAVGLMVLLVTKTWLGRRLMAASLVGYYLWHIGFDHAARSLMLAHVPAARVLAFWHEYLARPIETLGLHLLVIFVLTAWMSYDDIAKAARERQAKVASTAPSPLVTALTDRRSGV